MSPKWITWCFCCMNKYSIVKQLLKYLKRSLPLLSYTAKNMKHFLCEMACTSYGDIKPAKGNKSENNLFSGTKMLQRFSLPSKMVKEP